MIKTLLFGGVLGAAMALAGSASADTVRPEMVKMSYRDSSGRVLYSATEWDFEAPTSCGANCTRYDATKIGIARQNEIQLRMIVGDALPADEQCWYYDHDGSPYAWKEVLPERNLMPPPILQGHAARGTGRTTASDGASYRARGRSILRRAPRSRGAPAGPGRTDPPGAGTPSAAAGAGVGPGVVGG